MADSAGIELRGFDQLEALCADASFIGRPAKNFLTRSVLAVQNNQRKLSPVDRGQLRQAISHQVDSAAVPKWAEAGIIAASEKSPLWWKAVIMEYGAGTPADGGPLTGQPYKPKVTDDLHLWAKRHGWANGYAVANAIYKKGGIEPRRYLRDGFFLSTSDIESYFSRLGDDILAEWKRRAR